MLWLHMETFFRTRRSFCSRSEAERQKPPQAGSTESLMFLFGGKELFYQKGCKFAYVGVDQTRRRSLALQAGFGFAPNGAKAPCFLRKTSNRPSGSLRMTVGVSLPEKQLNICDLWSQLHLCEAQLHCEALHWRSHFIAKRSPPPVCRWRRRSAGYTRRCRRPRPTAPLRRTGRRPAWTPWNGGQPR